MCLSWEFELVRVRLGLSLMSILDPPTCLRDENRDLREGFVDGVCVVSAYCLTDYFMLLEAVDCLVIYLYQIVSRGGQGLLSSSSYQIRADSSITRLMQ